MRGEFHSEQNLATGFAASLVTPMRITLITKIGVAPNTIAQYEKGIAKTSLEVIVNLGVVLNTTTDYLLGIEEY